MSVATAAVLGYWLAAGGGEPSFFQPYTDAHGELVRRAALPGRGGGPAARLSGADGGAPDDAGAVSFAFGGEGAVAAASLEVRADLEERESAERLAASGIATLLGGDCEDAVAALDAASFAAPGDRRILNDRVAARLQCGRNGEERPLDLVAALDLVASEDGPRELEPRFNLASALDALGLRSPARAAWAAYLEADDGDSAWAEHARRRVEALTEPIPYEAWVERRPELASAARTKDRRGLAELVRAFPQPVLHEAERWLTLELPAALAEDRSGEARAWSSAVREVALALGPKRGGALLAAAADELAPDSPQATELALGYVDLGTAAEALERFDGETLAAAAARAFRRLEDGGSVYASRARYFGAVAAYMTHSTSEYRQSADLADRAHEGAAAVGDPETEASSLELLALLDSVQSRFGRAIERLEAARAVHRRAGWPGRIAAAEGAIAEVFSLVGDEERAWRHRLRALQEIAQVERLHVRLRLWTQIASAAELDYPRAAAFFAEEAARTASGTDLPLLRAIGVRYGALARALRGDLEGALERLPRALEWIDRVDGKGGREALLATHHLTEARWLADRDPGGVAALLDRVAELYRRTGYGTGTPELEAIRVRAHRGRGDRRAASMAVDRGVLEIERQWHSLTAPDRRVRYLGEMRSFFDEAVDLLVEIGDRDRALRFADHDRWPSKRADGEVEELLTTAAARLPGGAAVLAYRQLEGRTPVWVVRRSGTSWRTVEIGRSELARRVAAARRAIRRGDQAPPALTDLYDLLLRPVAPELDGVRDLVVVADGSLHQLPFAALRDRATGRPLVADMSVTASPSVSAAIASLLERPAILGASPKVLAVAQPLPRFPRGLAPLPHAAGEVDEIENRFPLSTIRRVGSEATVPAILAALADPTLEVFQVSAHALVNRHEPYRSSLVLAPAEDEDGLLHAERFLAHDLSHLELAILSACSSGGGAEGATDVATALLSAGVPRVLGSLWEVGDRPAGELMRRFYDALAAGEEPVAAFVSAQRALLDSDDPELARPSTWAAFQLYRVPKRQEVAP